MFGRGAGGHSEPEVAMSNTSNTSKSQNSQDSRQKESEKESEKESGRSEEEPREKSSRSKGSDRTDSTADDQPSAMEVLRHARIQLAELTGMVAESVSSFERTE